MDSNDEFELLDYTNYDDKKKYIEICNKNIDSYVAVDMINNLKSNVNKFFVEGERIERIINFNFKAWLKDVKSSFKSNDDIAKQFVTDWNRSNLYCNGNVIPDPSEFINFLENKFDKKMIRKILMFYTQVSLGLPYEIITKSLNDSQIIYYLGELSKNDAMKNNLIKRYQINLDTNENNKITFKLEKVLRIFKLVNNTDETVSIVHIYLNFNFDNEFSFFKIIYDPIKKSN